MENGMTEIGIESMYIPFLSIIKKNVSHLRFHGNCSFIQCDDLIHHNEYTVTLVQDTVKHTLEAPH